MGQKIEIRPNDQSLIGKKVHDPNWLVIMYIEILCVGQTTFYGRDAGGFESTWKSRCCDWELYEEPKKLLAPAMVRTILGKTWSVTDMLFTSEAEAKQCFDQNNNVIWPAIPNKDGFYEVVES